MPSERAIPHRFSNWIYPWRDTVFYGWYRVRVWSNDDFWSEIVKNKKVKQMICDVLSCELYFYKFTKHYFSGNNNPTNLITKYWKDDGCIAGVHYPRAVSLTANQLRGVNGNH